MNVCVTLSPRFVHVPWQEALKSIQLLVEKKREVAKNAEDAGGVADVPHAPAAAPNIAKAQLLLDRAEGMSGHGHVAGDKIFREKPAGGAQERGISPAREEELDEVLKSLEENFANSIAHNLAHASHEQDSATVERQMFVSLSEDSDLPGTTQSK